MSTASGQFRLWRDRNECSVGQKLLIGSILSLLLILEGFRHLLSYGQKGLVNPVIALAHTCQRVSQTVNFRVITNWSIQPVPSVWADLRIRKWSG